VNDGRERLRSTFEQEPALYDRVRPTYPAGLLDEFATHLPERGRMFEVGCGTGHATVPLARRGYRITAVELGPGLAALARAKLSGFADTTVVTADFETWSPDPAGFDAVVAFTALHWIDPSIRYVKPASLLRDGGTLAVVDTRHVLPAGGDRFFVDVQADYEAVVPGRGEDARRRARAA
jgi:SAM-dependent methyltransferase